MTECDISGEKNVLKHTFFTEFSVDIYIYFSEKLLFLQQKRSMYRAVYDKLIEWSRSPVEDRKPLLMEGARQVGKTWLARELGRQEFENFIELNFEKQTALRSLFELDFDLGRILLAISAFSGKQVIPGRTLLFFDEIQWAPRGLLALKYFYDEMPLLHVVAAGSLLGVIDHEGDSFPVGKVTFLRVFPMTFREFLLATGRKNLLDVLDNPDRALWGIFHSQLEQSLRNYYYVGGMPESVSKFVSTGDYDKVRKVQKDLLLSYKSDFSKHPPKDIVPRMHLVWDSIPTHLGKENKKFIYSAIRPGARAKDFETAIQWLKDAGMVYKQTRVTAGELPLKGFEDENDFRLFVVDIGLLGAMCSLGRLSLLDGTEFYKQFKGALTEQFVMQELICQEELEVYYWDPDTGHSQLDFVIQAEDRVIPLEAKAKHSLKAKSLKVFAGKYHPQRVYRTSLAPYSKGENLTEIPLYAISRICSE